MEPSLADFAGAETVVVGTAMRGRAAPKARTAAEAKTRAEAEVVADIVAALAY
jgi:hypothetical protein